MIVANDLVGTWKVTAFRGWSANGTEYRPIGDAPVGYAVLDAAGGIFIQLSRNPDEAAPEAVIASFMCYFGTYAVSGDALSIAIETGNTPHDIASTQTSTITREGDTLTIGIPGAFQAILNRVTDKADNALAGTWRVLSFARYGQDGAPYEPLGNPPAGRAVFDATGRAFIQLGKAPGTGTPDKVAQSLMCYFGRCSIDGDTVKVAVESSNIPGYLGSVQERKFDFSGDTLTLGTPGQYQAKLERVT